VTALPLEHRTLDTDLCASAESRAAALPMCTFTKTACIRGVFGNALYTFPDASTSSGARHAPETSLKPQCSRRPLSQGTKSGGQIGKRLQSVELHWLRSPFDHCAMKLAVAHVEISGFGRRT